ncbi:MAG: hypothetical protein JWP88_1338 [Flaviaesturariibacter sp.]|nr:hypothetical protein [Flaviaesturariibacter sp.]
MATIIRLICKIALPITISFSCHNPTIETPKKQPFPFDRILLSKSVTSDQGILVSCFRCVCVDEFLDKMIQQNSQFRVYGDSTCIRKRPTGFTHLNQKTTDKIYERNYNMILFKGLHSDTDFRYEILKSEDANKFFKLFNKFFRN